MSKKIIDWSHRQGMDEREGEGERVRKRENDARANRRGAHM
jgi:hypothetical protein